MVHVMVNLLIVLMFVIWFSEFSVQSLVKILQTKDHKKWWQNFFYVEQIRILMVFSNFSDRDKKFDSGFSQSKIY